MKHLNLSLTSLPKIGDTTNIAISYAPNMNPISVLEAPLTSACNCQEMN